MKIRKRNGIEQDFDVKKIENAVKKANATVSKESKLSEEDVAKVAETAKKFLKGFSVVDVQQVQDCVEKALMKHNWFDVAKSYVLYRDMKLKEKKFSLDEEKIMAICSATSEDVSGDNANKRATVLGTMRDYIAGTKCKTIGRKMLSKEITAAHDKGIIHFHDMDYSPVMPISNCALINTFDMFKNGFMMNDTWIDPPHSFATGANLQAQINLIVSGSQYGGQTVSWAALAPFVDVSRRRIREKYLSVLKELDANYDKLDELVEREVRKEVFKGVETYQYQCICHTSSNGQSPFVSVILNLVEAKTEREQKDLALIIEAVLTERIKGVKNKDRRYTAPLFPKLIYFIEDGINLKKGDPYFYLTELAARCNVCRMQPDYVSVKKCREAKEGFLVSPMGCRSFLTPYWHEVQYAMSRDIAPGEKFHFLNVDKEITPEKLWKKYTEEEGMVPDKENKIYPYLVGTSSGLIKFLQKNGEEVRIHTIGLIKLKNGKPIDWELGLNYEILDEPNKDYICLSLEPKSIREIPDGTYDEYKIVYNFIGNTGTIIKKENGVVTCKEPKTYGRWNQGVVTLNVPYIALQSKKKDIDFWSVLDSASELVHKALLARHASIKKIKAKNAPILWMYGGMSRLDPEDDLSSMYGDVDYTTISFGYIGLYETCQALIGKSNTSEEGKKLSKDILTFFNNKCNEWKKADGVPYSMYGTPEESLTEKASNALKRDFGADIPGVTDHDYVTNSYHVNPSEKISPFDKLSLEGEYLALSKGGAVSYVEATNLKNNIPGIIAVIQHMYDNILYAEINSKIDYCYECGYSGELVLDDSYDGRLLFHCPNCGCHDQTKLSAIRRACGYIGEAANGINQNSTNMNNGRLSDIAARYVHMQ